LLVLATTSASAAILGADGRQADIGGVRWTAAVGLLTRSSPKGIIHVGTAFVVGPRVILTNWHNLFSDSGTLAGRESVYVPDGMPEGERLRVLPYYQFTAMKPKDLPMRARARGDDVIALILAAPVQAAPLAIAPPAAADLPKDGVRPARYTLAGVALNYARNRIAPRTIQHGCALAGLAKNAQYARAPQLIAHTCDVWPGDSGAPLVDTADGNPVVRAINVAEVYPEYTRAAYEKRVQAGEIIPMSLTNHINIAIPIRPEIVDLVHRANAFAATLPVTTPAPALVAAAPAETRAP
jgi:V8-like Glu-specific endopeptidase